MASKMIRILRYIQDNIQDPEISAEVMAHIIDMKRQHNLEIQKLLRTREKYKEQRKRADTAERKLRIDSLTGAYNYDFFESMLKQEMEISREYGQPFTFAKIDLGSLKKINDTLGSKAGDEYLKNGADTIKNEVDSYLKEALAIYLDDVRNGSEAIEKTLRTSDTFIPYIGRFGTRADEFGVILPCTDPDGAEVASIKIAESLYNELRNVCSIGTRTYLPDFPESYSVDDLVFEADKALVMGKHGINQEDPTSRICIYEKTPS